MDSVERKHPRYPSSEEMRFSVSVLDIQGLKNVSTSATALNVSIGGACIRTLFALEPGQVLSISAEHGMKAAMVQWVRESSSGYVAGIINV